MQRKAFSRRRSSAAKARALPPVSEFTGLARHSTPAAPPKPSVARSWFEPVDSSQIIESATRQPLSAAKLLVVSLTKLLAAPLTKLRIDEAWKKHENLSASFRFVILRLD